MLPTDALNMLELCSHRPLNAYSLLVVSCMISSLSSQHLLPWTKKKEPSPRFAARRTLFDHVISCSITRDQRRAKSRMSQMTLPCADRSRSSMISQDRTAFFSPRISGMVLFFLSRVVDVHVHVHAHGARVSATGWFSETSYPHQRTPCLAASICCTWRMAAVCINCVQMSLWNNWGMLTHDKSIIWNGCATLLFNCGGYWVVSHGRKFKVQEKFWADRPCLLPPWRRETGDFFGAAL